MSEDNEDFFDVVGEDTDPVELFMKSIRKCAESVEVSETGEVTAKGLCDNVYYHENGDYKEIFCEKCGVSVAIDSITNFDTEDTETETVKLSNEEEDEFFDKVGSQTFFDDDF